MTEWGYASSGHFGAMLLRHLCDMGCTPRFVVTAAPKPAGRGMIMRRTAVANVASEAGLPLWEEADISKGAYELISEKFGSTSLMLVVDCGCLIKEPLLSLSLGCLNVHPSLLPDLRGAAPVQRAIERGYSHTGVSLFRLVREMDAGPVLGAATLEIGPNDSTESLFGRACATGAELFASLVGIPHTWQFTEQDHKNATYAPKIAPKELKLDWNCTPEQVVNKIRAFSPKPTAYGTLGGRRLKIHSAKLHEWGESETGKFCCLADGYPVVSCSGGGVKLVSVQPEGKPQMDGSLWWRGARMKLGNSFSG